MEERQAGGVCVIVGAAKSDGTTIRSATTDTTPRGINGNSRTEEYDSQIEPISVPSSRRVNIINKIRADSPLELCALAMLFAYVAIAPIRYGAITQGGTL